jgi:small redox-active disulfide protein 2
MKIQILGTGCAKCKKLYAETEKAMNTVGVLAQLEKIEKVDEIMTFGVMLTPALVVDGEVKSTGRIPPATEIASWLTSATPKENT